MAGIVESLRRLLSKDSAAGGGSAGVADRPRAPSSGRPLRPPQAPHTKQPPGPAKPQEQRPEQEAAPPARQRAARQDLARLRLEFGALEQQLAALPAHIATPSKEQQLLERLRARSPASPAGGPCTASGSEGAEVAAPALAGAQRPPDGGALQPQPAAPTAPPEEGRADALSKLSKLARQRHGRAQPEARAAEAAPGPPPERQWVRAMLAPQVQQAAAERVAWQQSGAGAALGQAVLTAGTLGAAPAAPPGPPRELASGRASTPLQQAVPPPPPASVPLHTRTPPSVQHPPASSAVRSPNLDRVSRGQLTEDLLSLRESATLHRMQQPPGSARWAYSQQEQAARSRGSSEEEGTPAASRGRAGAPGAAAPVSDATKRLLAAHRKRNAASDFAAQASQWDAEVGCIRPLSCMHGRIVLNAQAASRRTHHAGCLCLAAGLLRVCLDADAGGSTHAPCSRQAASTRQCPGGRWDSACKHGIQRSADASPRGPAQSPEQCHTCQAWPALARNAAPAGGMGEHGRCVGWRLVAQRVEQPAETKQMRRRVWAC